MIIFGNFMNKWQIGPEFFKYTNLSVLKGFGCFGEASKRQKEFAMKIGLNLTGIPRNVAEVLMEYTICTEFLKMKIKLATDKQIEFGRHFNWDFSWMPYTVASAFIKNILCEINLSMIEQQELEPGVWTKNIFTQEIRQILSISKNGLVKFTDMQDRKCYARSLINCNNAGNDRFTPTENPMTILTHEELLLKLFHCILLESETIL